ncbi:MAG: GNAT family N-acetyltransferase [Chloroflexi bacterium]|nr:GNAT family N-acetyltransferase [Chloroflexota bacterium]
MSGMPDGNAKLPSTPLNDDRGEVSEVIEGRRPDELPGISVRPARAEDCARCQEIAVAAWAPILASYREMLGDSMFEHMHSGWQARKAGQIAAAFEQRLGWILVACADMVAPTLVHGQQSRSSTAHEHGDCTIVGFVTYRLDEQARVGEIGNNAVDPAWQGRGIATALYEQVLARFRAAGMRVAKVSTGLDVGHAPARAAYRKVGFTAEVPSVTLYQELGKP